MLESSLQRKMMNLLKENGFTTRKLSAENFKGWPDLVGIGHGFTAFIEVKTVGGRLSEIQKRTIKERNEHGGYAISLWSTTDTENFISERLK